MISVFSESSFFIARYLDSSSCRACSTLLQALSMTVILLSFLFDIMSRENFSIRSDSNIFYSHVHSDDAFGVIFLRSGNLKSDEKEERIILED